jgi:hypothetical protein
VPVSFNQIHVWYFAEENEITLIIDNSHRYWFWLYLKRSRRDIVYLGIL